MVLNKQTLINSFEQARKHNFPFVFVGIEAEGIKEVIVIPKESFDAKEEFYKRAYSDDLVHVMNSEVRIFGLSFGEVNEIYKMF